MPATRSLLAGLRDVLAAPVPPQERLNQVVGLIAAGTAADVCSLYLLRAGEVLELFATFGLSPAAVHRTRLRIGEGLIGTVAATLAPLAARDAQSHPAFAYRPETRENPASSFCAVPLVRGGRLRGVLAIQHSSSHDYSPDTIELLQTVAMVLAELAAGGDYVAPGEASGSPEGAFLQVRITGITLNPGLATGRALLRRPELVADRLVAENPAHEVARLNAAISAMQASLDKLFQSTGDVQKDEVLETYRLIAADRGWIGRINEAIRSGLTAEAAVVRVADQIRARLGGASDAYLRDRLSDFEDLSRRLLQHLLRPAAAFRTAPFPADAVLVARRLGPAELLDIPAGQLRAVVLEEGAETSHVVIVARALGIPVIGQCEQALSRIEAGDDILVDADNAQVLVRPAEEVRAVFSSAMALRADRTRLNAEVRRLPSVTADGVAISLNLNCGLLLDVPQLAATQAEGIGLYRTEIPFLARHDFPDVELQADIYRRVLEQAGDRPVTFRTLDVGGDKFLPYLTHPAEDNPALGWRAIRIGLDRPALLRTQLRALLRAGSGRHLKLMFPMIADVSELRAARALLALEQERARVRGQAEPVRLEVGAMLEVPALLFQLPALLREVDFLSVGSNDLLQFFFAADRANREIAARYDPLAPASLNLLRGIATACQEAAMPLSLCGEMAGRPLEAMVLLGLGYRSLSLSAGSIDAVKLMLRSLRVGSLGAFLATLTEAGEATLRPRIVAFARDHGIYLENYR